MMKLKAVGLVAVAALLSACGGSSSSSDSGYNPGPDEPPFFGDEIENEVTLPDGTVIVAPELEDVDPDNVPIEMEMEYELWIKETQHLRSPMGNVYEFVLTEGGVESRQYLVFDWPVRDEAVVYALTDNGECYARPTADSLNAPLHGATAKVSDADSHAFDLQFNLLGAHESAWQVRWVQARNGLINAIQLVDNDGEVVASATSDESALEYVLKDGDVGASIRVPFEPMENVYSDDFIYNLCSREPSEPVIYEGFTVEYEAADGVVESRSFIHGALLDAYTFDYWFLGGLNDSFDDRYVYVGFIEQEGYSADVLCIAPEFWIELNHDYRSGGFVGHNSWSGEEGSYTPLMLTPDADGVISESSDPQLGVTPTATSLDYILDRWMDC